MSLTAKLILIGFFILAFIMSLGLEPLWRTESKMDKDGKVRRYRRFDFRSDSPEYSVGAILIALIAAAIALALFYFNK